MKYNAVLDVNFSAESSTEPVTLNEAKQWCKIELDIAEENTLITELIKSARMQCEGYLCISLIARTVTALLNNTLGDIELPYGPVVAFTSLTDSEGDAITSGNYTLKGTVFKYIHSPCYDNMVAIYTTGYSGSIPVNVTPVDRPLATSRPVPSMNGATPMTPGNFANRAASWRQFSSGARPLTVR